MQRVYKSFHFNKNHPIVSDKSTCLHVPRYVFDGKHTLTIDLITMTIASKGTIVASSFTGFHNPLAGFSVLIVEVSRSHTLTQHSRQDSSGRVISPSQKPLPDKHTTLTTDKHPCPRRNSNL